MRIQPIILAGGKGTRMGNPELPKVLTPLKGRPIMSYLLDNLAQADFMKPVLVVGYHQEKVRQEFGDDYTYILQEEQLGTGHAVEVCREQLEGTADIYIILFGDQPLWTKETMLSLAKEHEQKGVNFSLVTLRSEDPIFYNFGRIIRDNSGNMVAIREMKDCTEDEMKIHEYNPSMYCCTDNWMWDAIEKIKPNNVQNEYYLTDLLDISVSEGQKMGWVETQNAQEAMGINTPEQLEEVAQYL